MKLETQLGTVEVVMTDETRIAVHGANLVINTIRFETSLVFSVAPNGSISGDSSQMTTLRADWKEPRNRYRQHLSPASKIKVFEIIKSKLENELITNALFKNKLKNDLVTHQIAELDSRIVELEQSLREAKNRREALLVPA